MNRAKSSIKSEPADRQINRTKGFVQNPPEQFRSVHRTILQTALATMLVAAASLLTAVPSQAAVAYPMKSTQSVLVGPTSSAEVMGTVFDGERVSLFCYETTAGELWDYIEYTVDGTDGLVKRGWVRDSTVRTGTDQRLPDVQYQNCPAPQLVPGNRLAEPQNPPDQPPTVQRTCFSNDFGARAKNVLGWWLLSGTTRLGWCALDGLISDAWIEHQHAQPENSVIVRNAASSVHWSPDAIGRTGELIVAAEFTGERTVDGITGKLGGRVGVSRGQVEAEVDASGEATFRPGGYLIPLRISLRADGSSDAVIS